MSVCGVSDDFDAVPSISLNHVKAIPIWVMLLRILVTLIILVIHPSIRTTSPFIHVIVCVCLLVYIHVIVVIVCVCLSVGVCACISHQLYANSDVHLLTSRTMASCIHVNFSLALSFSIPPSPPPLLLSSDCEREETHIYEGGETSTAQNGE